MADARRIRVSRTAVAPVSRTDSKRMDALLTSLCDTAHQMKSLANSQAEEMAELMKLMGASRKTELQNDAGTAKIVTPAGRRTVTIDPVKFSEAVSADDFYACVSVGMEKAKKVLSEREIEKISTIKPAVPGDPKLVITPV